MPAPQSPLSKNIETLPPTCLGIVAFYLRPRTREGAGAAPSRPPAPLGPQHRIRRVFVVFRREPWLCGPATEVTYPQQFGARCMVLVECNVGGVHRSVATVEASMRPPRFMRLTSLQKSAMLGVDRAATPVAVGGCRVRQSS